MAGVARSSRTGSGDRRLRTWILAGIAALTAGRLVMAASVGLGDAEAYYWTWSRDLQPGYLDHGPAVAWLIRLGTGLAGDHPLGVRLPFILLSALTLWLVARAAARSSTTPAATGQAPADWRAGGWALLLLLAMPMFLVAGGAANPDVPFLLAVTGFALCLVRASRARADRTGTAWFALCGALAGLAFLAKFFGALLVWPLLATVWRCERRWLATVVGLGAMALCAAPQLLWNVHHGWPSLRYHLVERHTQAVGPSLANLGKLVGGQLAYVSPSVLVALAAAAVLLWRRRDAADATGRRALLVVAASLALPALVLIAIIPGAEPHWPAAGYVPLVLVAAGALPRWLVERRRAVRPLLCLGAAFSGVVALAFHVHLLTDLGVRLTPAAVYEPRHDLANELVGWPQVGAAVATAARRQARASGRPAVAGGCHYTTCAQLRFALRREPRIRVVCPTPRLDQFDLAPGGDGAALRGVDLLYLRDERFPWSAETLYRCSSVETVDRIRIHRGDRIVRRFAIELCADFGGLEATRWPPGRVAGRPEMRRSTEALVRQ